MSWFFKYKYSQYTCIKYWLYIFSVCIFVTASEMREKGPGTKIRFQDLWELQTLTHNPIYGHATHTNIHHTYKHTLSPGVPNKVLSLISPYFPSFVWSNVKSAILWIWNWYQQAAFTLVSNWQAETFQFCLVLIENRHSIQTDMPKLVSFALH